MFRGRPRRCLPAGARRQRPAGRETCTLARPRPDTSSPRPAPLRARAGSRVVETSPRDGTVDAAQEGARCGFPAQEPADERGQRTLGAHRTALHDPRLLLSEHSSMRVPTLFLSSALVLCSCAGMNVKKTCYGDGVCRVENNGVVSYEGPPDKVAAYEGKAKSGADAQARAEEAYLQAPKRAASEPVRVVVIGPSTEMSDLVPLTATYHQMLEQALQGDPRIQLVPYSQVKLWVEAHSDGESTSMFAQNQVRTAVDQPLTRRLRDGSGEVDVVVVAHLSTKKVSGLVSGGGGVGVAEVNNVVFELSLSSVYRFAELRHAEVGKSSDSLALAGIDKKGKTGSGQLKGKRNPESDRPAVVAAAAWVKTSSAQLAPDMPSIAAAKDVRQKNTATALQDAPDWMKKLMSK